MKDFVSLYEALDSTMSTNGKIAALVAYFKNATPEDAAWAIFFLSGRRFKRFISSRVLSMWFMELSGFEPWLYEACYESVGDTAETIALLCDELDKNDLQQTAELSLSNDAPLAEWIAEILELEKMDEIARKNWIFKSWGKLDNKAIFILNKLLTGGFRVGVSQKLLIRAIAEISGLESALIAHRLMGHWEPSASFYQELIAADYAETDISRPYPFFLAYPLENAPETLGAIKDWQVEWKWDGIRAQMIRRDGKIFVWSRGEDLLNGRFPELEAAAEKLPDGMVLDGEILAHDGQRPLPFSVLQTRIGRKNITPKLQTEAPVAFIAYDLLEYNERDIRMESLKERREKLSGIISSIGFPFLISENISTGSWEEVTQLRESSREKAVEGFVIKRLESSYQSGRKRGDWWKWKIDPYTIDAVLIYAQAGTGRRANLFTDYTFAVWEGDALVPIAKAYSGLSNEEIAQLDRWIRNHTNEKFGPVRSVDAVHVFELGFEGISESKRHKSGVALRFPRILRWRTDKPVAEADTLDNLKGLLHGQA